MKNKARSKTPSSSSPPTTHGEDLAPLYLADEAPAWRSGFFYEHPTFNRVDFIPASQALVRKDWKYFYWPEHDVDQLFHIEVDPHEQNDLASDPAHAEKARGNAWAI